MGRFFDKWQDGGQGLNFLSKEEKEVLIEERVPFPVLRIIGPVETQYGPRFIVVTDLGEVDEETGETVERAISFGIGDVESRDRMLAAMQKYLEEEGAETPVVVIDLVGRSQIIRDPEAEVEAPTE